MVNYEGSVCCRETESCEVDTFFFLCSPPVERCFDAQFHLSFTDRQKSVLSAVFYRIGLVHRVVTFWLLCAFRACRGGSTFGLLVPSSHRFLCFSGNEERDDAHIWREGILFFRDMGPARERERFRAWVYSGLGLAQHVTPRPATKEGWILCWWCKPNSQAWRVGTWREGRAGKAAG